MPMHWDLSAALRKRRDAGLLRRRQPHGGMTGPLLPFDDSTLLAFCSNDYLGLAGDPRVIEASCDAARRYGAGSGASAQVSGYHALQRQLEQELAEFLGHESCLVFSSGFLANTGTLAALLSRHDSVLMDRLNHASLIDGARLSGARLSRYPHRDAGALDALLRRATGRKLVVSDGVFSMDGDLAPLADLRRACDASQAWLMLDDAHGFGTLGATGRGTPELQQLRPAQVDLHVATLGKAAGASGGFVAGSAELIDYLQQFARTAIYSTAMPPMNCAAALAGLRILRDEPEHRQQLAQRIRQFRDGARTLGLPLLDSETAIQPLLVGAADQASRLSEALRARGLLVPAMRPPTVPENTARLRITLSAAHSSAQVEQLLDALAATSDRQQPAMVAR